MWPQAISIQGQTCNRLEDVLSLPWHGTLQRAAMTLNGGGRVASCILMSVVLRVAPPIVTFLVLYDLTAIHGL